MDPEIPSSLQKTGRGQQKSPPFVAQVSSNDRTPLFNPASNNNDDNNNNHHHQLGNQPDMVQALFKAQTTAYPPLASFKSTSTDARTHTHTHPHHRRGGGGGEEGMIPLVVFLWVSVAFLVCLAVGCLALLFTKLWCKWKGWREVRNRRKIQGEREWFRMSDLSGVGQP